MKFYIHTPQGYIETNDGPPPRLLKELLKGCHKGTRHTPGDGWHYVPGDPFVFFNNGWSALSPSSESQVIANFEDICNEIGVDPLQLQKEAYPNEFHSLVEKEDRKQCARKATIKDAQAVCDDLTDINYHQLQSVFADALEKYGIEVE